MSDKSKIQLYLETDVHPKLDAIQKDHDKQVPTLLQLGAKIDDAIKKKANPDVLNLYLKTLKPGVTLAGELVSRASKLMDALAKLEPDPNLGPDFAAVEAMTKKASDLEGKLKRNFEKLKVWEDLTEDAIGQNTDPGSEFAEAWAVIETLMNNHLANVKWRVKQNTEFLKKAKQAVLDRDAKELGELVVASSKFREGNPVHSEVEKKYKEFLVKTKATGLHKEALDQLNRDLPGLKKNFEDATAGEAQYAKNDADILDLRIKPLDVKKALTVLKIPSKFESKLKAALEARGDAREKALDDIAKAAGLKTSGDDMIEALQKAKVL